MQKPLLLVCTLLMVQLLSAQLTVPVDLFEPLGDVQFTIAMDADADGDLDVVCAASKRLFWQERRSDNSFSAHNVISSAALVYSNLIDADINEDGLDDLLYCTNENGLGVHLNLGDGSFAPANQLYYEGEAVTDFYVADLNGNGHLDVIASSNSDVRWLPSNGDGTFGDAVLLSDEYASTTSVHADDLDGDGELDILVAARGSGLLTWHENLGNGNFAAYQVIEDSYAGPRSVVTADYDGDNLTDVVCAYQQEDEGGAGLVWYRNLGDGTFSMVDTLMARGWHNYVQTADMDADGDMDIVSAHGLDEMDWLANDGNGNFSDPIALERRAAYLRFFDIDDINDDGFPDVLYGINSFSPQKQNVLWRESTGGGNFAPHQLITLGGRTLSKPQLADFDGDGRLDVTVGVVGSDALVWLRNEGQGFSQPKLIARQHNFDPRSIAVVDINNDGFPDVFANTIEDIGPTEDYFCFYLNDGNGNFTAAAPFPTLYDQKNDLQMVDMDSDGDLDMLWSSPGYNGLENGYMGWVRNDGGSWGEPILLLSEAVRLLDVLATDFDGDGQMDLIVCKNDFPRLSRMEHTGGGNFSAPVGITNNFAIPMYAQAFDFNGDGMPDLIASDEGSNSGGNEKRIAWFPNTGNGQFGAQQDIYIGSPPMSEFEIVDFNLDGYPDIVAGTYLSDVPMQLIAGLPNATFAAPVPIAGTANAARNFVLGDIDGDGDWDILANGDDEASGNTDRLLVSFNLANDPSVSGIIFYDDNMNGQQDANEFGVSRIPVTAEPEAFAVFADEEGRFTVYGGPATTYTLRPELADCWTLTTPETIEVSFDGSMNIDSLRFGVTPNTETPVAEVTVAAAPTRCGFTVPFWLNYRNDGCWAFDGEAYLVLDELVTFESASPEPSRVGGDTLFWAFAQLQPGSSQSVELMMIIAGVEFLGETIELPSGLVPLDGGGAPLPAVTFDFSSIINCAYDPNDKQVYPNRAEQPPFDENYTLFEEKLLYTLRFQNTGTDTAFNIVLRDQLSADLDWTTFLPGSSSHPYEATLHDDGLLEFHFRDILLVDSFTNEPLSHGFVQFEIAAQADLAEATIIENTAGIYFDFNPPIVTNTVNSILVESLPNFTPAAAFTYMSSLLDANFEDVSSNEPENWLWDFGDGTTSTLQHPTHTYASAGTYTVCLTASNDWGSNEYCEELTITLTSITEFTDAMAIQLHPNPARDLLSIVYEDGSLPQQLVLYSAAGKPLQSMVLRARSTNWDISTLPAGSYWVRTERGEVLQLVVVK